MKAPNVYPFKSSTGLKKTTRSTTSSTSRCSRIPPTTTNKSAPEHGAARSVPVEAAPLRSRPDPNPNHLTLNHLQLNHNADNTKSPERITDPTPKHRKQKITTGKITRSYQTTGKITTRKLPTITKISRPAQEKNPIIFSRHQTRSDHYRTHQNPPFHSRPSEKYRKPPIAHHTAKSTSSTEQHPSRSTRFDGRPDCGSGRTAVDYIIFRR
jgi:hypothetical protein